ncbi:poly(U)-specific endoribonuclease-B-like [Panicum miliaceum]|uniref:Poly(U)-specific endoribonuclease-B-like n=1 Tax=Panicum miliaceum TaxID=4540 RepID=A0A3L6PYN3_PANMI|nr:poly(U)-specific endoribonuclease-B-like [Panicum miliaceum]
MEGLIKGLVHVAIDAVEDAVRDRGHGGGGGDDNDEAPRRGAPQRADPDADGEEDRDERSRSTWAEVVSEHKGGGPDDERRDHRNSWRDKRHERRDDEGWERVGGRNQQHHGGRQNQEGERINDGGWQTVGEKKNHGRPQQSEAWNGYRKPPSEQQYSEDVDHQGLNVEPTREELNSLSKACSRLWELDMNRLVPGKDYRIDCGEGKKVYQKGDMASESLFSWLGDDVLRKPTYSRFCALLDNYNPHQGYKEVVTQQDKHEEVAFIEEIARTAPIKYLHRYLVQKGEVFQDYEDFKRMLASLWFDLYGRGGNSNCSSAFEHVFVGEIKGRGQGENEVSGFHNWIQASSCNFYLEEAKGNVDYQGYIFPRRRGESPDSETQLLTVQFEWHGVLKSVSSTLIGVSPEFEVALYTLCFFVGGEDNRVDIGPYTVNIKCYRLGKNKIGSAFPIAEN